MGFFREVGKFLKNPSKYLNDPVNVRNVNNFFRDTGQVLTQTAAGVLGGIPIISDSLAAPFEALNTQLNEAEAKAQHKEDQQWQSDQAELARQHATSEREATQEYNTEMWEKNNEHNKQMLDEQREYDSPAAQVQRAIDAGLNPAELVDGGNGSTPVTSTAPTSSPGSSPAAASPGSLAAQLLTAQSTNAEALARIRQSNSQTALNTHQLDWNVQTFGTRVKLAEQDLANKQAEYELVFNEAGLTELEKQKAKLLLPYVCKFQDESLMQMQHQTNLIRNQSLQVEQEILNLQVEYENAKKQGLILDGSVEQQKYQTRLLELQAKQEKLKYDFSAETGIPYGTDKFSVAWKLHGGGNFGDFIDVIRRMSINENVTAQDLLVPQIFDYLNPNGNQTPPNGKQTPPNGKQAPKPGKRSPKPGKRVPKVPIGILRNLAPFFSLPFIPPMFKWQDPDYFGGQHNPTLRV